MTALPSNQHRFRVIYGDTDMAGIVYYANYLRFFEAGRGELLRSLGLRYRLLEERGLTLPVVQAEVKYLSPARYEDELLLTTKVDEVRNVSLFVSYRLERESTATLIATGRTGHACVNSEGKLTRLPADYRSRLSSLP
ncbi:MAG: thioesterase family protein [Myxococcota bacterium]